MEPETIEQEGVETSEVSPEETQGGIDDMLSDYDPSGELAEEEETLSGDVPETPAEEPPAEETPAVEPEVEEPEGALFGRNLEETPEEPGDEAAEAVRYRVGGNDYTIEEIQKSPELLNSVLTTAGQHAHLQNLYAEQGARLKSLESLPAPVAEQPPQQAAQITPERVVEAMAPAISRDIEGGFIENDANIMFPKLVSALYRYKQMFDEALPVIQSLHGNAQEARTRESATQTHELLEAQFDRVVDLDPRHAPLKERKMRDAFTGFLMEHYGEIPSTSLPLNNVGWVEGEWLAFSRDSILQAQSVQQERKRNGANKNLLLSEGAGGKPPAAPAVEEGSQAAMLEDMMQDAERNM